jgi:hypothetical protein
MLFTQSTAYLCFFSSIGGLNGIGFTGSRGHASCASGLQNTSMEATVGLAPVHRFVEAAQSIAARCERVPDATARGPRMPRGTRAQLAPDLAIPQLSTKQDRKSEELRYAAVGLVYLQQTDRS